MSSMSCDNLSHFCSSVLSNKRATSTCIYPCCCFSLLSPGKQPNGTRAHACTHACARTHTHALARTHTRHVRTQHTHTRTHKHEQACACECMHMPRSHWPSILLHARLHVPRAHLFRAPHSAWSAPLLLLPSCSYHYQPTVQYYSGSSGRAVHRRSLKLCTVYVVRCSICMWKHLFMCADLAHAP